MLCSADLPSRTSVIHTHRSRFSSTISRFTPRRRSYRILAKSLLGVALPAVLLSMALPSAQPVERSRTAPAASFALTSVVGGFSGDRALSETDAVAASTLGSLEGTLDFGAPAKAPVAADSSDLRVEQKAAKRTMKGAKQDATVTANARGYAAARVAMRYVGSRYRWGGASPRGFDCSGLVLYAWRHAGVNLPHKAAGMFSTRYGARVRSIGALRAGDIVFFRNTAGRGITHVALYVGNGRMVTANSPRSGVVLSSINTRYWRSHFAGAIRP